MNKKKAGFERVIILLAFLIIGLIIAIVALGYIYYANTPAADNILIEVLKQRIEFAEGLSIDGINVGNMTIEEARPIIQAVKPESLGRITIQANGQSAELDLSSLVPERDYESSLQRAILLGNQGEREERNAEKERIATNGENIVTPLKYDASPLKDEVNRIAESLKVDPIDASVRLLSKEEQEERGVKINSAELINSEDGGSAESINSLFEYAEELPGSKVDADDLMIKIQAAIDANTIDQPVQALTTEIEPQIKLAEIQYEFAPLASASTSFAKSPYNNTNRMFNINKAAEIINGYILMPGEEFSCNGVLGDRTTSRGWKEAGAIKDGQSVVETGGGICQVSSTLYNAVLKSDLEVVKRSPHSWPLSYITTGQDATISTGGPDFIFKNNFDKPVIVVAAADLDKKNITIMFYGEKKENPEFDEIKLVTVQTGTTKQPSTETYTNRSLRAGTTNTIRQGRAGSTHETYKEYYKDGVLVKKELSHYTKYRAIAGLVERGPAAPAAPVEAPVATQAPAETNNAAEAPVVQAPAETKPQNNSSDEIIDIPEE